MEIITRGRLPEEIEHTTTCTNCNTRFKFQRREAQKVDDWRDGDYLKIECPLCHKECTISLRSYSNDGDSEMRDRWDR